MELTHRFTVPTGIEETWAHFQDVAGLAGCFPGAQVTSVDGDGFTGTCKVKLGPIALVYTGTGSFTEQDVEAHRFVVLAKGKDKRGNGTAAATATLTMAAAPSGGTDVSVVSDLAITGKPAQFGRGLIQDVSDKLLGQFVACLEQQLGSEPGDDAEPAPPDPEPEPVPGQADSPIRGAERAPAPEPTLRAVRPAPARQPEALDLGAAVLPVLLRSYRKQALAGLAGLAAFAVIIRLITRSRR